MAIDFATIAFNTGAYPAVVSTNESVAGAKDGTPFTKIWIDDYMGFGQAIMYEGGYVAPSGSSEVYNASERLTGLKRICGHPGEVIGWMGTATDPSASNIRLLPLNGQGVLVATYADLNTFCWVGSGLNATASAFYRASDAAGLTRAVGGAYLILPDCRGVALRGLDTAAARDPDGASRDIGNFQQDTIIDHKHAIRNYGISGSDYIQEATIQSGTGIQALTVNSDTNSGSITDWQAVGEDSSAGTGYTNQLQYDKTGTQRAVSAESRMQNVTCIWCIRY